VEDTKNEGTVGDGDAEKEVPNVDREA